MAVKKIPELEAQKKKLYIHFWAEELQKLGFHVTMNKDGSMRAVCKACGQTYKDRFAFAKEHFASKCPGPQAIGAERHLEPVLRAGQTVEAVWKTPNGPRRVMLEIKDVREE